MISTSNRMGNTDSIDWMVTRILLVLCLGKCYFWDSNIIGISTRRFLRMPLGYGHQKSQLVKYERVFEKKKFNQSPC
jgi:hypothetical protein